MSTKKTFKGIISFWVLALILSAFLIQQNVVYAGYDDSGSGDSSGVEHVTDEEGLTDALDSGCSTIYIENSINLTNTIQITRGVKIIGANDGIWINAYNTFATSSGSNKNHIAALFQIACTTDGATVEISNLNFNGGKSWDNNSAHIIEIGTDGGNANKAKVVISGKAISFNNGIYQSGGNYIMDAFKHGIEIRGVENYVYEFVF
jgi:hypothetical protein